eukprot:scaffold230086_cov34-Tisochrysis_lutea.AAC.1
MYHPSSAVRCALCLAQAAMVAAWAPARYRTQRPNRKTHPNGAKQTPPGRTHGPQTDVGILNGLKGYRHSDKRATESNGRSRPDLKDFQRGRTGTGHRNSSPVTHSF